MTFSVTGRCGRTGMLGVAVASSAMAIGARCPFVRAGVGAVAVQGKPNPRLGPDVLARLARDASATSAVAASAAWERSPEHRQILAVAADGSVAVHSGSKVQGRHAYAVGDGVAAAGSSLVTEDLPHALVDVFSENAEGHIADRLLRALEAGMTMGGEDGAVHSAALLVADVHPFPLVDLRVDRDEGGDPVGRLRGLWRAYEPQAEDVVTAAVAPGTMPKV